MKRNVLKYFASLFTFLMFFNGVISPILQVGLVFAEESPISFPVVSEPKFDIKAQVDDVLQGGKSKASVQIKNLDENRLVNIGFEIDLPLGFEFGGTLSQDGELCEKNCINPEVLGSKLVFRNIADLLSGESVSFSFILNTPEFLEIGSLNQLSFTGFASYESDLSSPAQKPTTASFKVLPILAEISADSEQLVGEIETNEITITSNPTTDSATLQIPASYPVSFPVGDEEQVVTDQTVEILPVSYPQEEPASLPEFDFVRPPAFVEVSLDEGVEYIPNTQRVENYDPSRVVFDYFNQAIESVRRILRWTLLDGITTQSSTNPIKIFFDIIARSIGHNNTANNSLRVSAVYEDQAGEAITYEVNKDFNSQIGYFDIKKTCSPAKLEVGDTAVCNVKIQTTKEHRLTNLQISDLLPDGIEFVDWDLNPLVEFAQNNRQLEWIITQLDADTELNFTYRVRVLTNYEDLSKVLTSDNFKSFVSLKANWQNVDGGTGYDQDDASSKISIKKPEIDFKFTPQNSKSIEARIGDVVEVSANIKFPSTLTKDFELQVFAPVGTIIKGYSLDPDSCDSGCEFIKLPKSDIDGNTEINFTYSIEVLDDNWLNFTSIVRNLIRAYYINSQGNKQRISDELVIQIIEPKVEITQKLQGILARGEVVSVKAVFKNTGKSEAFDLVLHSHQPLNTTLVSPSNIDVMSNLGNIFTFSYDDITRVYSLSNPVVLLPNEQIELVYQVKVDDVDFGTKLHSQISTSIYTNQPDLHAVGRRAYGPVVVQKYDRAVEPLVVTNIVSSEGNQIARGVTTNLSLTAREVGKGTVYETNKQVRFFVDGVEVTIPEALEHGFKIEQVSSSNLTKLNPLQVDQADYKLTVLQGTPFGRKLTVTLSFGGLNALSNQIRKDGSAQTSSDIDPIDFKSFEIIVSKNDFDVPFGEIKFFNTQNEETGFTNQQKIKLQLEASDNVGIQAITYPGEGLMVFDSENNTKRFKQAGFIGDNLLLNFNGEETQVDFASGIYENEYIYVLRVPSGIRLIFKNVPTDALHKFEITDWNENTTKVSKQITYDIEPPTLAWLSLSPRAEFENVEFTTTKLNYAHFGLTDNNPSGFYRYSLDGETYTNWSALASGKNVELIDFSSQDGDELEVFFQFKDLAGNEYPETIRASIKLTNQKLQLNWNFQNQYTNVAFTKVDIEVFNPANSSFETQNIWIGSGQNPENISLPVFNAYLPEYLQIQTGTTGTKQLCVQVTSITTQISDIVCRNIVYDILPPEGTANFDINSISFLAHDPVQQDGTAGSEPYVRFKVNGDWTDWTTANQTFSTGTLPINSGTNHLFYQFKDLAGNTTEIKTTTFSYNPVSNSRILINNGNYFTDIAKVKVNLNPARNLLNQMPSLFRIKQVYQPNDIARNANTNQSITQAYQSDWTGWTVFNPEFEWRLNSANFENLSVGTLPELSFGKYELFVEYMYPNATKSATPDSASIIYTPVYASIIEIDDSLPTQALTADKFNYNLNVKNVGSLTWLKANEGVSNPVRLVYRYKHLQENIEVPWGSIVDFLPMHYRGGEFELPSNIFYNQEFSIPIQIRMPDIIGLYELEIDLVHEGVSYFGDLNNPTIKQVVNVTQNPDLPVITAGINPETGQPFNYNLPQGVGGYYAGQIINIYGIWEKASSGAWWSYEVWMDGINYKFTDIHNGDAYLGKRVHVVVRATGVEYNYQVLSIAEIEPTFSASLYHRSHPQTIVVNRGQTGTLFYQFLNTGSVDAVWPKSWTVLRNTSGDGSFTPIYQVAPDQLNTNPGAVASFRMPFSVASNKEFGDYIVCFTLIRHYNYTDRHLAGDCVTFRVQPTEAEQKQIICSQPHNVYAQPSTTATVLGTLNQHDSFIHTRSFGDFLEIFYGSSGTQVGYIQNTLGCFTAGVSVPNPIVLTPIPPPPARPSGDNGFITKLDEVQVLHGPSELFPASCTINFNQPVKILGEVDFNSYSVGWLKVTGTSNNGSPCEGWVSKGYVDYEGQQKKLSVSINPEYAYAHVCGGGHAVHTGPAYEFPRTSSFVSTNQNLEIRQEWNGWVHIGTGWIPKSILCRGYYVAPVVPTFTGSVGGATVFQGILYERPLKDPYHFTSGFYDLRCEKDGKNCFRHSGSDYAASCETPVYAAATGTVSNVVKGFTEGRDDSSLWHKANLIYIDHPNGTKTTYIHLQDVYVNLGDHVKMGQLIGTVGNTGWSTGCHLHFEIWAGSLWETAVDPEEVFEMSKSGQLPAISILRRQSQFYSFKVAPGDLGQIHPFCGTFVKDYVRVKTSEDDKWPSYTHIMYNPDNGQSYMMRGGLRRAYLNQSGCELLMYPIEEEAWTANSPRGTSGAYQRFTKGVIYSSRYGSYVVAGNIYKLHESIGGTRSKFGFPTSTRYKSGNKICQNFEGGRLCEDTSGIEFEINFIAGNRIPTSGVYDFCGGKRQDFKDRQSAIYNPKTGKAYLLGGAIAYSYWTNGGCEKFGLPVGGEGRIDNNRGKGWYQHFEKGNIYWHETHKNSQPGIVTGSIRNYFEAKGGVSNGNEMGWPEGSEWSATSYTCNNNGVTGTIQHFTNGKIYLSSLGTIFIPWSEWNWINHYENVEGGISNLGWPKTGKVNENGVERMYFEKGYLEGRWYGAHWGLENISIGCSEDEITNAFVDRVLLHLKNGIGCFWGGETIETGVDCRGLALLSIREVTNKSVGGFECDKLGFCDMEKNIPSTGADGLAKNYFPYLNGQRKSFNYTESTHIPKKGGLTAFDWENDGIYDHINIIVNVGPSETREWIYSNADCSSENHLININEIFLLDIYEKIIKKEELSETEYQNIFRVKMANLTESMRLNLYDFLIDNETKLLDYHSKETFDHQLSTIMTTRGQNLYWSDNILNYN